VVEWLLVVLRTYHRKNSTLNFDVKCGSTIKCVTKQLEKLEVCTVNGRIWCTGGGGLLYR